MLTSELADVFLKRYMQYIPYQIHIMNDKGIIIAGSEKYIAVRNGRGVNANCLANSYCNSFINLHITANGRIVVVGSYIITA